MDELLRLKEVIRNNHSTDDDGLLDRVLADVSGREQTQWPFVNNSHVIIHSLESLAATIEIEGLGEMSEKWGILSTLEEGENCVVVVLD